MVVPIQSERGRPPVKRAKNAMPPIADQVLGSLAEFTDALEAGHVQGGLTVRRAWIDLKPTAYTARMVRGVRETLGVSQALTDAVCAARPKFFTPRVSAAQPNVS